MVRNASLGLYLCWSIPISSGTELGTIESDSFSGIASLAFVETYIPEYVILLPETVG